MPKRLKVGELYAGIGGLSIAIEWAFDAEVLWQMDLVNERIRTRQWPNARQIARDVRTLSNADGELTATGRTFIEGCAGIDILGAGFSCQDLSTAGTGDGFEGRRTGPTYRATLHFIDVLRPQFVVLENVPALLSKHRAKIEEDLGRLGYAVTWIKVRALDAGAPHKRARVFVVAELGGKSFGVLEAKSGALDVRPWATALAADGNGPGSNQNTTSLELQARTWPTPTASNPNEGEPSEAFEARKQRMLDEGGRPIPDPISQAARTWPTPTAKDANASGSRLFDSKAHAGTSLTDAIRPDRTVAEDRSRPWPTPCARDHRSAGGLTHTKGGTTLNDEAMTADAGERNWATPAATDYKSAEQGQRIGQIGDQTGRSLTPQPRHVMWMYAHASKASRSEALRLLREDNGAETLRKALGGQGSIQEAEVLRLLLRWLGHPEAVSDTGGNRKAGKVPAKRPLRSLRHGGDARHSSRRRGSIEQLANELADALRKLPHPPPLADGQGDAGTVALFHLRESGEGPRSLLEALSALAEMGDPLMVGTNQHSAARRATD